MNRLQSALLLMLVAGWTAAGTPAPATRPAPEDKVMPRQVDVTILGRIDDVKGLQWTGGRDGRFLSTSIAESCDLTVRLPSGRTLHLGTRPILVVGRAGLGTDVITTVSAPPAGKKGSMADKVDEIERLLADWRVTPDERMRATLDDWKRWDEPGSRQGFIASPRRVRTDLDERTQLSFSLSSIGEPGWNLVVEIDARPEEWAMARRNAEAWKAAATQPATRPVENP